MASACALRRLASIKLTYFQIMRLDPLVKNGPSKTGCAVRIIACRQSSILMQTVRVRWSKGPVELARARPRTQREIKNIGNSRGLKDLLRRIVARSHNAGGCTTCVRKRLDTIFHECASDGNHGGTADVMPCRRPELARSRMYPKGRLMKASLLMLVFVAAASPVLADPHRAGRAESGITCDTVRAYVSQVGVVAAKAMARANGMTAAQERRARQCLASRD
jgi:hypothetical protein